MRPTTTTSHPLTLERLEPREVPALLVQLDFSLDSRANGGSGFFESNPQAQAVLSQVAAEHGARISAPLAGINPGGGNTWTASFFDPRTGAMATLPNLSVGANAIRVFVGARAMNGGEAGVGGFGGYSASGTQGWLNSLNSRGHAGFGPWGGSLAFDTGTNWWFGSGVDGIASNQVDFYSVAVHEMGHLLGIGTAPQWNQFVSGGHFHGPNAQAVYGGPVPLNGTAHWADGVTINGQPAALDPTVMMGTRVGWSALDQAALGDVGWQGVSVPTSPPAPPVAPVPIGSPLLTADANRLVVLTGPSDGTAQVFAEDAAGTLTAAGPKFNPFPNFTGVIRSVVADFNGDGQADFAFGTGAGTSATLRIISGATGNDLVLPTGVFEGFSGGLFLAAGDVDRNGAAELAISADAGGGTRVSLFKITGGQLQKAADFYAYGDSRFRGGSRVALGDVNKDGAADLIVGAGVGGAPRVAIYDGKALLSGAAKTVVPDFYALDPNLRSGVFVTASDLDGDGYADVLYSTGTTGGPRVRAVSGFDLSSNPGTDAYYLPAMADFFAFDPNDRSGIRLVARDLNADGKAELVVASGSRSGGAVRVLSLTDMKAGNGGSAAYQQPLGNPATFDGIYVG